MANHADTVSGQKFGFLTVVTSVMACCKAKEKLPKRLEVKAASGKKYNFSQIFGPELRRVVR